MDFKNFLERVENDLQMRQLVRKNSTFHIEDGYLKPGYPEKHGSGYVTVTPDKTLTAHDIDPTNKQFKDIIKQLQKYIPDIQDYSVHVYGSGHAKTGKLGISGKATYNVDRPISYYMGHPTTDIQQAKYLYHGTSTELWYSGIKKEGLLPRNLNKYGAGGSYGTGQISREGFVYLAVHPDQAARGAAEQAAQQHGGQALILRINTSGLEQHLFHHDEDVEYKMKGINPKNKAAFSAKAMGTVAYKGKIAPSLIEPFLLGQQQNIGNSYSWKWRKFTDVARDEHPLTKKLKMGETFWETDSPYFYALVDAGIIEKKRKYAESGHSSESYEVVKDVSDADIKELIKKSTWARDAATISKILNSMGGENTIREAFNGYKAEDVDEKVKEMLLNSGIYTIDHGLMRYYVWESAPYAIKLAKELKKNKMTLSEFLVKLNRY